MCETHGKLVDNNRGTDYAADLLISYRELHEAWILREQSGRNTPFGWIQEVTVRESRIFTTPSTIRLGKLTLLHGLNGTGKTAVCQWIAGAAEPKHLENWIRTAGEKQIRYEVVYHDPAPHSVSVAVEERGLSYTLDDTALPFNPLPFSVVYLTRPDGGRIPGQSDVDYLCSWLGIDSAIFWGLLESVTDSATGLITEVRVGAGGSLRVGFSGRTPEPFTVIGGGAQDRVGVELAIAAAQMAAKGRPTILMLDGAMPNVDRAGWQHYSENLTRSTISFQTVLTAMRRYDDIPWTGWEKVTLEGKPPKVVCQV